MKGRIIRQEIPLCLGRYVPETSSEEYCTQCGARHVREEHPEFDTEPGYPEISGISD